MRYQRRTSGGSRGNNPVVEDDYVPKTRSAVQAPPRPTRTPEGDAVYQDLYGDQTGTTIMETGPKGAPLNRDIASRGAPRQQATAGSIKDTMSREEYEEHIDELSAWLEVGRTVTVIERDGSGF